MLSGHFCPKSRFPGYTLCALKWPKVDISFKSDTFEHFYGLFRHFFDTFPSLSTAFDDLGLPRLHSRTVKVSTFQSLFRHFSVISDRKVDFRGVFCAPLNDQKWTFPSFPVTFTSLLRCFLLFSAVSSCFCQEMLLFTEEMDDAFQTEKHAF